jgi:hypothetical protein
VEEFDENGTLFAGSSRRTLFHQVVAEQTQKH